MRNWPQEQETVRVGMGWLGESVGACAGYLKTSARGGVSWIPVSATEHLRGDMVAVAKQFQS